VNPELDRMMKLFFYRYYPLVVDKKGRIIFITKKYADFLKKNHDDLIGKYVKDVIPGTRLIQVLETEKELFSMTFKISDDQMITCDYLLLRDENGIVEGACCLSPYFVDSEYEQDIDLIEKLYKQVNHLKMETERYKQELFESENANSNLVNLIGETPPMLRLKRLINKVADTALVILITGETGVGKEVVGNAIHQLSKQKSYKYVKINCASIPRELMESELFGYEGGSFSGASKNGKIGKFEFANNGTILLDEIGEMPFDLQGKLLRVLQEKEIVRVGGLKPISLNVRVICSTNRDLKQMVQDGTFRKDLFYRINVLELNIPPLRERKGDIGLLCDSLIKKINHYHNTYVKGVTDETLELFMQYDWPGNVRELEHVLERACVISNEDYLDTFYFDLIEEIKDSQNVDNATVNNTGTGSELFDKKASFERDAIIKALAEAKGNKSSAAKKLGISRQTLYEKIRKLDIGKRDNL